MASSGQSSVGGGKRGKHQSSTMSLNQAMTFSKKSSSKPNLNSTPKNNESKVTNKPNLSGKRMK